MQSTTLILLLGFMATGAFFMGRGRSLSLVGGAGKGMALHSLPGYYGYFLAIWVVLPALVLISGWVLVEPKIVTALVVSSLPDSYQSLSAGELNLLVNNIRNLASGDVVSIAIDENLRGAADQFNDYLQKSRTLLTVMVIGLAALGGALGWRRIQPDLRARNKVEAVIRWVLFIIVLISIFVLEV